VPRHRHRSDAGLCCGGAGAVAAAQELARRTGLGDRVSYRVASALDMPFEDRAFDAAITIHVAMNIKDRGGLYKEIARVLKPGAVFCIYDVMRGGKDGVRYPVPWAETPATSHLTTPQEMQALLRDAGFAVHEVEDGRRSASPSSARCLPARQRQARRRSG
jgi:ubiquinone/menaquinone biosynthesis C-methylase UbiE